MKTIKLVGFLTLTLLLAQGCVPDDGPIDPQAIINVDETDEETGDPVVDGNPEEETPTEDTSNAASNTIADNIIITGSEKIEGTPPIPNGAISLDLSSVTKTGLPEAGFDIDFFSEADIVGAYIQFKATDAIISDSYFDVDILKNAEAPDTYSKSKRRISAKIISDVAINIDFTPQLQTGNFCYTICVYDAAGNISAPQEVCVNVNSWGGNTELVGAWDLIYYEDIAETENDRVTVGVERCDEIINRCDLIEFWTLTLNSDGTFENILNELERDFENEAEFDLSGIERLRGNWSYDPISEELVFLSYFYEYEENGVVIETEIDEIVDGDVFGIQGFVVNSTTLQLIWEELDNNGDGNSDEGYIEYYEKQ